MNNHHFKILFLSSNKETTSRFSGWLATWGFGRVYNTTSLLLIPDTVRNQKLDLILYDPDSCEETIAAICTKLLGLFLEVPILILETDTTQEEDLEKALHSGAYDYIAKNSTENQIRRRIHAAVQVKRILSKEKEIRKELILDNIRLEEELEQQKKSLKESIHLLRSHYEQRETNYRRALEERRTKILESLTEGVAHTFNNLFQVILGHTFLLRPSINRSGLNNSLSIIETAVTLGAKVIQQLIAYNQDHSAFQNDICLNDVIQHQMPLIKTLLRPDISIRLHLAPDMPLLKSRCSDMEWVLLNLITNAQEAMPTGGIITIETCFLPGETQVDRINKVELRVQDTGTGMNESTLARIFDPFFTTKINNEGRGLGLTITQKIVDELQGAIFVASVPAEGSTFTVRFPAIIPGFAPVQEKTGVPPINYSTSKTESNYHLDVSRFNKIQVLETV